MSLTTTKKVNDKGAYTVSFEGPTVGIDRYSGDTKLFKGHVPFMQNMHLEFGVPRPVNGFSLLDTGQDAEDDATPLGAGQLIEADGTETYVQVQADGVVNRWDSAGNAWIHLHTFPTTPTGQFNTQDIEDTLVFVNPGSGNWKYDGTNWLPLGSKIINTAEATTDWALTGAGQTGLAVSAVTFTFGLNSLTFDPMLLNEVATLTYDPATLNVDTGIALARAYTEDDRLEFWVRFTDASSIDTATTLVRIETTPGNDFDIAASAWTDETGAVITLADNTWHRVSVVISSGTEAGTYDHTTVDNIQFVFDTNGTGGTTVFLDQVYMAYNAGSTMPGVATVAVWEGILWGAGATVTGDDPANLHFSNTQAPDEYNALAFFNVDSRDGGGIAGIRRFFNQLFVGKESSIHSLGGSSSGQVYPNFNYEILDITREHGCDGHRAIAEANRKLWFTWHGEFYEYDGNGTKEISDPISNDFDDTNFSLTTSIMLQYWHKRREIWGYYAGAGDTFNIKRFRFDPYEGVYVEAIDDSAALQVQIMFVGSESNDDRFVGIDSAGDWMRLDDPSATDFDGTAITQIYRLPWADADRPEWVKYWGDLYVAFDFLTSGTITVQVRTADHPKDFDAAAFTTITTLDTDDTAEGGWVQLSQTSRFIQIQFTATAVQFSLQYPITFEATPIGRWA